MCYTFPEALSAEITTGESSFPRFIHRRAPQLPPLTRPCVLFLQALATEIAKQEAQLAKIEARQAARAGQKQQQREPNGERCS